MRRFETVAVGLVVFGISGCAGSTYRSGVGDRMFERPPYYAGGVTPADSARIGHLPVGYQRDESAEAVFSSRTLPKPVAALLSDMNLYLDSLGVTVPLDPAEPAPGTPPDVRFGCETDAAGDCIMEEAHDPGRPQLWLSVGRPSEPWVVWLGDALNDAGATNALVLTVEPAQYWPRQRNLRGDKVVDLGTEHTISLPWLTSLETPVSVVQLTGALVDGSGKALRIGVEGLMARRTSLLLSSVGGQALITDEEIRDLRERRREDLPGRPLVWQVALRHLVARLTDTPLASSR